MSRDDGLGLRPVKEINTERKVSILIDGGDDRADISIGFEVSTGLQSVVLKCYGGGQAELFLEPRLVDLLIEWLSIAKEEVMLYSVGGEEFNSRRIATEQQLKAEHKQQLKILRKHANNL